MPHGQRNAAGQPLIHLQRPCQCRAEHDNPHDCTRAAANHAPDHQQQHETQIELDFETQRPEYGADLRVSQYVLHVKDMRDQLAEGNVGHRRAPDPRFDHLLANHQRHRRPIGWIKPDRAAQNKAPGKARRGIGVAQRMRDHKATQREKDRDAVMARAENSVEQPCRRCGADAFEMLALGGVKQNNPKRRKPAQRLHQREFRARVTLPHRASD